MTITAPLWAITIVAGSVGLISAMFLVILVGVVGETLRKCDFLGRRKIRVIAERDITIVKLKRVVNAARSLKIEVTEGSEANISRAQGRLLAELDRFDGGGDI